MLKILNLETGYEKLRVVKGVSLHVSKGEVVALLGANGAGKTTLLSAVAGIVRPWAGKIIFDEKPIEKSAPERIVSLGCSMVPEGRQVFGTMTVMENLVLGGYSRRRSRDSSDTRALLDRIFDLFPILRERSHQHAGTLSGGEQQMLAIGRALMADPKLIMLDEPSMGVAPIMVSQIFKTIRRLKESGVTMLLVEQNARAALSVADRGYVLESGQIVCDGAADELLNDHELQRAYLGKDYHRIDE